MDKKNSAKIIASILKEKDLPLDKITREALETALRCLRGQNSKASGGSAAKSKGATGEREWASKCREQGYSEARRGVQYSGLDGNDCVGLPGIHQEVKRVEKLNLYDAMDQSKRDAKEGEIPIVAHRKNNYEWLVTMPANFWFKLYKEWEVGYSEQNG